MGVSKRKATASNQEKRKVSTGEEEFSRPQWKDAIEITDLAGPLILLAASHNGGGYKILTCSEDGGLQLRTPSEVGMEMDEHGRLCPVDVTQVLVGQILVPGKVSLKTANRKYLSACPSGKITATRDAVGPTEEWRPKKVEGGFALQDVFDRYLSVDNQERIVISETCDEAGFKEIFMIRCQAGKKTKKAASDESKSEALRLNER